MKHVLHVTYDDQKHHLELIQWPPYNVIAFGILQALGAVQTYDVLQPLASLAVRKEKEAIKAVRDAEKGAIAGPDGQP